MVEKFLLLFNQIGGSYNKFLVFPGGAVVKNLPADAGDASDRGSIPGSGRFAGGGQGHPPQYSCLESPMG